jgi:hypothetical protein
LSRVVAQLVLLPILAIGGCSRKPESGSQAPAAAQPVPPPLEDRSAELHSAVLDLVNAHRNYPGELPARAKAWLIPEPEAWFAEFFQEETAKELTEWYGPYLKRFPEAFARRLDVLAAGARVDPVIVRLVTGDEPECPPPAVKGFRTMKARFPMYLVQFHVDGKRNPGVDWVVVFVKDKPRIFFVHPHK